MPADLFITRATCPKDGWTLVLPLYRHEIMQAILHGRCKVCQGPVAVEPAHLTPTAKETADAHV